jgi:hypothetical protein
LSASEEEEEENEEEEEKALEGVAGFEGKQVQVCDPGNVQDYDYRRLQQLVDKKSNG